MTPKKKAATHINEYRRACFSIIAGFIGMNIATKANVGTLGTILDHELASPSVIVIGKVASKRLDWFESHETGTAPYFFSKELVQVYTMRSSRPTQQRGVRTNSVCPAPIDTPLLKDFRETMTDKLIDWNIEQGMGRPVTGREVGMVLAFLASDAAAYVNGVNMLVDGGFTSAMTTGQVDFAAIS